MVSNGLKAPRFTLFQAGELLWSKFGWSQLIYLLLTCQLVYIAIEEYIRYASIWLFMHSRSVNPSYASTKTIRAQTRNSLPSMVPGLCLWRCWWHRATASNSDCSVRPFCWRVACEIVSVPLGMIHTHTHIHTDMIYIYDIYIYIWYIYIWYMCRVWMCVVYTCICMLPLS